MTVSTTSSTGGLIGGMKSGVFDDDGNALIPYLRLLGTQFYYTIEQLADEVEDIFGPFDYVLTAEEKADAPTTDEFLTWHSLKQIAWIKHLSSTSPSTTGEYTIGADGYTINVILSHDEEKIYILEHLQKSDVGFMPLEDQLLVVATDTWLDTVSVQLDMWPTGTQTIEEARDDLLNSTTDVSIAQIRTALSKVVDGPEVPFPREYFETWLTLLEDEINGTAILSPTQKREELVKVNDMFTDMSILYDHAYGVSKADTTNLDSSRFGPEWDVDYDYELGDEINKYVIYKNDEATILIMDANDYGPNDLIDRTRSAFNDLKDDGVEPLMKEDPAYSKMVSLDGNQSICDCFDTMSSCLAKIVTLKSQYATLVRDGTLDGKSIDGITLIAMLMQIKSQVMQIMVEFQTAKMELCQTVMSELSIFLDLLNATLEKGDPDKPNQEFGVMGLSGMDLTGLSEKQLRAIACFSPMLNQGAEHPIFTLANIVMPDIEFFKVRDKATFTELGSQNELVRWNELDEGKKERLMLSGLHNFNMVAEFKGDLWEHVEKTKTEWDTATTRAGQGNQSLSKYTERLQNELTNASKTESRFFDAANKMQQNVGEALRNFARNV